MKTPDQQVITEQTPEKPKTGLEKIKELKQDRHDKLKSIYKYRKKIIDDIIEDYKKNNIEDDIYNYSLDEQEERQANYGNAKYSEFITDLFPDLKKEAEQELKELKNIKIKSTNPKDKDSIFGYNDLITLTNLDKQNKKERLKEELQFFGLGENETKLKALLNKFKESIKNLPKDYFKYSIFEDDLTADLLLNFKIDKLDEQEILKKIKEKFEELKAFTKFKAKNKKEHLQKKIDKWNELYKLSNEYLDESITEECRNTFFDLSQKQAEQAYNKLQKTDSYDKKRSQIFKDTLSKWYRLYNFSKKLNDEKITKKCRDTYHELLFEELESKYGHHSEKIKTAEEIIQSPEITENVEKALVILLNFADDPEKYLKDTQYYHLIKAPKSEKSQQYAKDYVYNLIFKAKHLSNHQNKKEISRITSFAENLETTGYLDMEKDENLFDKLTS